VSKDEINKSANQLGDSARMHCDGCSDDTVFVRVKLPYRRALEGRSLDVETLFLLKQD